MGQVSVKPISFPQEEDNQLNSLWEKLPRDVVISILKYLEFEDLLSVNATCKKFYFTSADPALWRDLYVQSFGNVREDVFRISGLTWKAFYLKTINERDFYVSPSKLDEPSFFGRLTQFISKDKRLTILMLGFHGAGKTTALYKLRLGETVTIPTIGFQVETPQHKQINMAVWNMQKMRPMLQHYLELVSALIVVVDSTDPHKIEQTAKKLESLYQSKKELTTLPCMIFANKQDLPGARTPHQIIEPFQPVLSGITWFIQATCCTSGDGLYEGLDWLQNVLRK